jgi:glycosyltransferase involved in cell wall biosynthesis
VPEKGVHVLLDALALMTDWPWQLLMDSFESKDAYARQLRAQIDRLRLAERVVFFESSHEDMPDYMNAADLVVLPSLSTPKWKEQYGRVIQEAQACGRIVIASESGAIPETMDGQGYLVPEGDAPALAERLCALLERPCLASAEAAQSARTHRSVRRQAEIMDAYLRSASST